MDILQIIATILALIFMSYATYKLATMDNGIKDIK